VIIKRNRYGYPVVKLQETARELANYDLEVEPSRIERLQKECKRYLNKIFKIRKEEYDK